MDGASTRDYDHLRAPVRLHPSQASGESNHQERAMAPPPSPQQGVRGGASALEDTLGEWLKGNHQAEVGLLQLQLDEAISRAALYRTESQLYADYWRESMAETDRVASGLEVAMMGRERLISLLMYQVIKGSLQYDMREEDAEQLRVCMRYAEELRMFAQEHYNYECMIRPANEVTDRALEDIAMEELEGMTTEEDSEHEVIDLTGEETETDTED